MVQAFRQLGGPGQLCGTKGSELSIHMGKTNILPLSRSRMISLVRMKSDESSSLDLSFIHSSMAVGTAPAKTSLASA